MSKGKRIIGRIRKYFEEARKDYPEIEDSVLCGDGAIYYMNGNDSTEFDWDCNNRLCEFFMFYDENKYGFIKVFVNRNDVITGYLYLDKGYARPIHLDEDWLEDGDALYLASLMNKVADKEGIWDEDIEEFDFDTKLDEDDFLD